MKLAHFGFAVSSLNQFTTQFLSLELAELITRESDECMFVFDDGSLLQVHQSREGRDPVGVKPAIQIGDHQEFCGRLSAAGIAYKQRPGDPFRIDFKVGGVPFHTVEAIS